MDIKEIAKRIRKTNNSYMLSMSPDIAAEFAEALIESYKAELLKEAGEPVLYAEFAEDGGWLGDASEYADHLEEPHALFTSDQVAAAIAKATGPMEDRLIAAQEEIESNKAYFTTLLEEQRVLLAKAEQRVAEACKSMCLSLDRKEKNHAAGYGIGYLNYSAQDVADLIDNGEWRKFVKEV